MGSPIAATAAIESAEIAGNGEASRCPWRENPYSLVSWWDVHNFAGEHLHTAIMILDRIRCEWAHARLPGDPAAAWIFGQRPLVTAIQREKLAHELGGIPGVLQNCGLAVSANALSVLNAHLLAHQSAGFEQLSAELFVGRLDEIQRTIQAEMQVTVFLYVQDRSARLYSNPVEDWQDVVKRWPETRSDLVECSKCFALDRFAAAVFHVLLVAEFGVIQVANLLKVSGDKPGWGSVERLERILDKPNKDRSALEQQHLKLLQNSVPEMLMLKADRHALMHVDNKGEWLAREIGPPTATDAIGTARKFMRRLAAELP